jgi:hypothetical protein
MPAKGSRKDAASKPAFRGGVVTGAMVRTPCGPRRVDLVGPGDMIVTRDNGMVPVRMVWHRTITAADIARHPDLAPVRLCTRAVAPMMPQKDLSVAPDQRVMVPGFRILGQPRDRCCLVEAQDIAQGSDAAYRDAPDGDVRYFTFVFDSPQVFAVNGLMVESFVPSAKVVTRLAQNLRRELVDHYPELKRQPDSYPPAAYPFVQGAEYLPDYA